MTDVTPRLKVVGRAGKICSIETCTNKVLARGWCGKHYSRWQNHGDPEHMTSREPGAPVVEVRSIDGVEVHFTAVGEAFVMTSRVRRGKADVPVRRYGKVIICEACKKEVFIKLSGANRFRFCSNLCAGPATGHAKLGKTRGAKPRTDHLDKLFSIIVRSAGICANCKGTDHLQCAHGFSRRYRKVRWDTRNAFCLCARCHMFFTHRPLEWDEWLLERWGFELYYEIRKLALDTTLKVDPFAIRDALVEETIRRGITANKLPKTISGWAGMSEMKDA